MGLSALTGHGPTEPLAQAHLPDLAAITRVYPDDKRLTVSVPWKGLSAEVAVGDEVELYERDEGYRRRPHPESGRVRGRVKRLVVEIEIDLGTYSVPVAEGQGELG